MARTGWRFVVAGMMLAALAGHGQAPVPPAPVATALPAPDLAPIAFVPFGGTDPLAADKVKGQIEVAGGKAVIAASGEVSAGSHAALVQLTHRGEVRLCATTTVALSAATPRTDDLSGLMLSLSHGALEARFATGHNADVILTPDFRISISGPGVANVDVRLGDGGDTCVDNHGEHPATVVVSSVFEGGAYSVGAGQRVMFEHGSLHEVVDQEKEPCGCPPSVPKGNEFPLAQSEGLAPLAKPAASEENHAGAQAETVEPLVYKGADHAAQPAPEAAPAAGAGTTQNQAANPAPAKKKPGFFGSIGRFFRRIFGAE